jgi:phosphate transport system protein
MTEIAGYSPSRPVAFTQRERDGDQRSRSLETHQASEEAGQMRETYRETLDGLTDDLVQMSKLVGTAMERATTALLDADLALAESVIAADENVDLRQNALEAKAFDLLALQHPVATDLRIVVTALRMSAELERMGDLAQHIAKIARMRYPDQTIPNEFRPVIADMSRLAVNIVAKAVEIIEQKDVKSALELERDDDEMDLLHRKLFTMLLQPSYRAGIECAIDITLCGRYYERYADHAVSVARRVVYLVTGEKVPGWGR